MKRNVVKRERCACGHAWSAHRGAEWRHHRKGACRAGLASVNIVGQDGSMTQLEPQRPCPCEMYVPEKEEGACTR